MNLAEVVKRLNNFASPSLAESWDNVGLLIEPPEHDLISKILLTNDLTEAVLNEAITVHSNFIISYHPVIFRPIKKILASYWKDRVIASCLHEKIAVFSPHTTYDALSGGVNDWLVGAFGKGKVSPVQQTWQGSHWTHEIVIGALSSNNLSNIMAVLQAYDDDIHIRNNNELAYILCSEAKLPNIVSSLSSHISNVPLTVSKLDKTPVIGTGMGRISVLEKSITLHEAVQIVKNYLNLSHIRLAVACGNSEDSLIKTVAVCAGSGASLLRGVKADLYLTGEMSHHEVLDAVHAGASVILTDHSNSERGFLKVLQPKLVALLDNNVEVVISETDADPLSVV